tara:strand:- start:679 stop:1167 length:489 start_codon:yes stop_codon:yes gene_type:complete
MSNQVNNIYNDLVSKAKASKNGKLSSDEINSKYLVYVETTIREKVVAQLDENGFITRSTKCDSILCRTLKREIDQRMLRDLLDNGKFVIEVGKHFNENLLDKIIVDPDDSNSQKLYVESDNKVGKTYGFYNPTINNGNESHRRYEAKTKKLMQTSEAKKILK